MVSQESAGEGEDNLSQLGDHSASLSGLVLEDESNSWPEVEWVGVVCVAVDDCGCCSRWDGIDEDCV